MSEPLVIAYATLSAIGMGLIMVGVLYAIMLDAKPCRVRPTAGIVNGSLNSMADIEPICD